MTFIATRSGRRYHFLAPSPDAIDLEDIAYALAHQSRFTGHAGTYSVATHSMHVADIVAHYGGTEAEVFAGLIHDAHESYVGDMSSPLKALCPDYQRIEAIAARVVRQHFGVSEYMPVAVVRADRMACHDEGAIFVPDAYWSGPFSGLLLTTEGPIEAMERWLARVRQAMRERRAA